MHCSPQRKFVLSGAQRAPRGKYVNCTWRDWATARELRSGWLKQVAKKHPFVELTGGHCASRSTVIWISRSEFADGPELVGALARLESRSCGPVSADTPNF